MEIPDKNKEVIKIPIDSTFDIVDDDVPIY
jgi:hypothetical protein